MSIPLLGVDCPLTGISYKPPTKEHSKEEDDSELLYRQINPYGSPYLTRSNGRLVFARDIKPENRRKAKRVTFDLLGEAFGVKARISRKRSKSVDEASQTVLSPVIVDGVAFAPQNLQVPHTAPLPQQGFPSPLLPVPSGPLIYSPHPPYAAFGPLVSGPTTTGLQRLQHLETGLKTMGEVIKEQSAHIAEIATAIAVVKHVCASCGRLRSRRYHMKNPITPGVAPKPDFCGNCQRDASSSSSEHELEDVRKKQKAKSAAKSKRKEETDDESLTDSGESSSESPPSKSKAKKRIGEVNFKNKSKGRASRQSKDTRVTSYLKGHRRHRSKARYKPRHQDGTTPKDSSKSRARKIRDLSESLGQLHQETTGEDTEDTPARLSKIRISNYSRDQDPSSVALHPRDDLVPVFNLLCNDNDASKNRPVSFIRKSSIPYQQHENESHQSKKNSLNHETFDTSHSSTFSPSDSTTHADKERNARLSSRDSRSQKRPSTQCEREVDDEITCESDSSTLAQVGMHHRQSAGESKVPHLSRSKTSPAFVTSRPTKKSPSATSHRYSSRAAMAEGVANKGSMSRDYYMQDGSSRTTQSSDHSRSDCSEDILRRFDALKGSPLSIVKDGPSERRYEDYESKEPSKSRSSKVQNTNRSARAGHSHSGGTKGENHEEKSRHKNRPAEDGYGEFESHLEHANNGGDWDTHGSGGYQQPTVCSENSRRPTTKAAATSGNWDRDDDMKSSTNLRASQQEESLISGAGSSVSSGYARSQDQGRPKSTSPFNAANSSFQVPPIDLNKHLKSTKKSSNVSPASTNQRVFEQAWGVKPPPTHQFTKAEAADYYKQDWETGGEAFESKCRPKTPEPASRFHTSDAAKYQRGDRSAKKPPKKNGKANHSAPRPYAQDNEPSRSIVSDASSWPALPMPPSPPAPHVAFASLQLSPPTRRHFDPNAYEPTLSKPPSTVWESSEDQNASGSNHGSRSRSPTSGKKTLARPRSRASRSQSSISRGDEAANKDVDKVGNESEATIDVPRSPAFFLNNDLGHEHYVYQGRPPPPRNGGGGGWA